MAAGFTQSSVGPALWLLDPPGATAVTFRLADAAQKQPPASTTLDALWDYPGVYVVLPAGTPVDSTLAGRLRTVFGPQPTARFAWVANPTDPPAAWRTTTVALDGSGSTTGVAVFGLRSIALWLTAGCTPALNGTQDGFIFTQLPGPDLIYLTVRSGEDILGTKGDALHVPLSGPQAGALQIPLTLAVPDDLDTIDAGLRLFEPQPDSPLPDRLRSWRFPVFTDTAARELPVTAYLDPLAPDDVDRTFLDLAPGGATGPELGTTYQSTIGGIVMLTALGSEQAPARLVPQVRALAAQPNPNDPLYFVPSGAFRVRLLDRDGNTTTTPQRLLCGTVGVEYVTTTSGDELWFGPGGNALAGAGKLDPGPTTAYAAPLPASSGSLVYSAQPDGSPLHSTAGSPLFGPPTDPTQFLTFLPLAGQPLPPRPGSGLAPGVPLFPYGGVDETERGDYARLELATVAPARRAAIKPSHSAAARIAAAANTGTQGTTRQGLIATFNGGMNLLLGQSHEQATLNQWQLDPVSDPVADALQSPQLFLVASDPTTLQPGGNPPTPANGKVTIGRTPADTWTFQVFADGCGEHGTVAECWADRGTLLVMKFAGSTLQDLARDTSKWATPDKFNPGDGAVDHARASLVALVDDAIDRANKGDADFAPFKAIACDTDWHGILVFNCDVPLDALPTQILGLAAGIDAKLFRAHHLGVTVTPVEPSGGPLTIHDSSLFGLVDYQSPTQAQGGQPPYFFQVTFLKVLFRASAVASFSSLIELLVDELFAEPVELAGSKRGNVLQLSGVYQRQSSGAGTYTFSTTGDNLFAFTDTSDTPTKPTSAVLQSVDVANAQFVTVVAPDPTDGSKRAESRFVLTGSVRFLPQAFDVMSFGSDTQGQPAGQLFYSNLSIDVSYVPDEGNAADVYTFDATALVLDPAQSKARPRSLFDAFPLTPSGFVHVPKPAADAKGKSPTPASLGYLGVETPALPQSGIEPPWFGIIADLGLGTAGALAAKAGFKSTLLAAWSPSRGGAPNIAVGLTLPGTGPAAKLLSLESVLKLKVGDLTLTSAEAAYVLQLQQIALSILSLTLPPAGQVEAMLFADPTGADHTSLGWYAGYAKAGSSK
ncbi:MAG: hypothetical protein ACRDPC_01325 [Solirubrobacteraceae bacterium]